MITTISASRAARVRTGQLVSTDDELARSISAGRWWNRQRDLVDIVGWEDFASHQSAPCLQRALVLSLRHGSTPGTKHLRTLRGVESVLSSLAWVEAGVPGAPRF